MGVSVREKKPGEWWVFVAHKGKRRSKKIGADKTKALEIAKKLQARLVLGDLGLLQKKKEIKEFGIYALAWLEEYVRDNCKASTYRSYKSILNQHLLPIFGKLQLDSIQREDIKTFLSNKRQEKVKRTGKKISINRVKRIKAVLLGIFSSAVDDHEIASNPAARLDKWLRPKDEPLEDEINPYTAIELELYLNAMLKHFPRYYPLFLTYARTGLRLGEALTLKWADVDFNGGFFHIGRALVEGKKTTTKSRKPRMVTISPQLLDVLKNLQAQRPEEAKRRRWHKLPEEVFVNTRGKFLDEGNLRERVHYKACKKAKLRRVRIHDIRHSYATIRINAGHNLADISNQLGHASIKITVDTYYKWIAGTHQDQVAELDKLGIPAPSCTPAAPTKNEGVKQDA